MKNYFVALLLVLSFIFSGLGFGQELTTVKINPSTSVKDQGMSGTCWCFSIVSMIESDMLRNGVENPDLSELYIVRNIYIKKYIYIKKNIY